VLATTWPSIDPDGIDTQIQEAQRRKQSILDSDDSLRELREQLERLEQELKIVVGEGYAAGQRLKSLIEDRNDIIDKKDRVVGEVQRIERAQIVTLTDEQRSYLDTQFAEVAAVGDRDGFAAGARRLKERLGKLSEEARDKADRLRQTLETAFQRYLDTWPDPNL